MSQIIAIDGPAASGKSSVARALAKELGFGYVNSGAMYRALTWHVLQAGVNPQDGDEVSAAVERARLTCDLIGAETHLLINGIDPEKNLRAPEVNTAVSAVSRVPPVREKIVALLRSCARERDVVMEGRDIGTIVFPKTPFKFYLDAAPDVRAQRRRAEGFDDEIAARDRIDSSRQLAPLAIAAEAEVIDTSALTITGVVAEILGRLAANGFVPRR